MNMSIKHIRFFLIFSGIWLFAYEAGQCIHRYVKYETVSKQSQERQENHPMPQICLSSPDYAQEKLKSVGIDINSYRKEGQWISNSSQLNEEEMFSFASPRLNDLVDNIDIRKTIAEDRDAYLYIKYNI